MDQARASGAPITAKLGGVDREFRRLSRRDFGTLIGKMHVDQPSDRQYLSVFDVHRWAGSPEGSIQVLALAAGVEPAVAAKWGNQVQQATVASLITAESLTTGDEDSLPGEGEKRSDPTSTGGTTSPSPAKSLREPRASATPGT